MVKWWNEINLVEHPGSIGAARYTIMHMVEDEIKKHEPPIVTLKNGIRESVKREPDEIWKKHIAYMENFEWYKWYSLRVGKHQDGTARLRTDCEHYIRDNSETLILKFLLYTHKTIEKAILETESLTELWNEFEEWFSEKKREFMEKTNAEIVKAIENKTGVAVSKKPHSCGGIANLLKVLTKTMQQQGADIRTIAKVQYAICTQNGVYIPDEFLTDVAVVLDGEGEL